MNDTNTKNTDKMTKDSILNRVWDHLEDQMNAAFIANDVDHHNLLMEVTGQVSTILNDPSVTATEIIEHYGVSETGKTFEFRGQNACIGFGANGMVVMNKNSKEIICQMVA